MSGLSLQELYERWVPVYPAEAHCPPLRAEQALMLKSLPNISGRMALDLACGSGRYARILPERGAQFVVALDFSEGMLRQVRVGAPVRGELAALAGAQLTLCELLEPRVGFEFG